MGNQKSSHNSTDRQYNDQRKMDKEDRQYNDQRKRDRRQTIADNILHTTQTIKNWAIQIPL